MLDKQSEIVEDEEQQRMTEPTAKKPDLKMQVDKLNFWYGRKQALYNVSLDVPKHHVTALIGPSGCGKSTFLRSLNRMNETIPGTRSEGKVTLDGIDIYREIKDAPTVRRKVGMVFQRSNPFPKSIYDNVAYGLRVNGINDKAIIAEAVEDALRQAALWDEVKDSLDRNAYMLSGGQQQRLCIARALAVRPEVVLMDEPASALDPIATTKIEELVRELKEHFTIVIVTHNMHQAGRVSDLTAFFYQGVLVEVGPTKKMFTKPNVKKTEEYITGRFG